MHVKKFNVVTKHCKRDTAVQHEDISNLYLTDNLSCAMRDVKGQGKDDYNAESCILMTIIFSEPKILDTRSSYCIKLRGYIANEE